MTGRLSVSAYRPRLGTEQCSITEARRLSHPPSLAVGFHSGAMLFRVGSSEKMQPLMSGADHDCGDAEQCFPQLVAQGTIIVRVGHAQK